MGAHSINSTDIARREYFMRRALDLAKLSLETGDVPVGAVIVREGEIIGRGYNCRERDGTSLGHAEICAIAEANRQLGSWRLEGCTIYVTLEPCPMCAGALLNSRIDGICCGAPDPKAGACGGVINIFEENFNHRPKIYKGILMKECSDILSEFFIRLRDSKQERFYEI